MGFDISLARSQPVVSSTEVGEQLGRIVGSTTFARSPKLRRFLTFSVEEILAGRGEKLTEYDLAAAVFDRHTGFDPRLDSIVRVQANKLRRKLADYYDSEGAKDPLKIEMPKGSYAVVFRPASNGRQTRTLQSAPHIRRTVLGGVALGLALLLFYIAYRHESDFTAKQPKAIKLIPVTFDSGFTSHPSVTRDRRVLTYDSDRAEPGNVDIWVQRSGRPAVRLTADDSHDVTPDISPDGSKVVFRSSRDGGGIYVISTVGGVLHRIAPRGYSPRFSPDGSWIAYGAETPEGVPAVFVISAAGGKPLNVWPSSPHAMLPVWGPGGRELMILSADDAREESYDWWVIPIQYHPQFSAGIPVRTGASEALEKQRLGKISDMEAACDWHRGQALFLVTRESRTELWELPISAQTMKVSGQARQLLPGPDIGSPRIVEEPDGTDTVYFSQEVQLSHVWILRLSVGGVATTAARLTDDTSITPGLEGTRPAISPDGAQLLFASRRLGHLDLWRRDLVTLKETPLTTGIAEDTSPVFSASGHSVAFDRLENKTHSIYVIGAAGGPTRICSDCGPPRTWFRDQAVLYIRNGVLWSADASTGETVMQLARSGYQVREAAVSSDQKWIALAIDTGKQDTQGYLARLDRAGHPAPSPWIWLTSETYHLTFGWSPDDSEIYFFQSKDNFRCLWQQALNPLTKRPVGAPTVVRHFHSYQSYPLNGSPISVGRGVIAVKLSAHRSNIWMAKVTAPR